MSNTPKITQENFAEHFFDVRQHAPKPGQVMATYTAVAEFANGPEKRDIIKLLKMDKAQQASLVMKKIHLAKEPDCYRVCREMAEDMLAGMTDEQVEHKPYEYMLQAFFYTKPENVPTNDPHWDKIQLLRFDKEKNTFYSDITLEAPKEPPQDINE